MNDEDWMLFLDTFPSSDDMSFFDLFEGGSKNDGFAEIPSRQVEEEDVEEVILDDAVLDSLLVEKEVKVKAAKTKVQVLEMPKSPEEKEAYRLEAVRRWKEKRQNRSFKKRTVCVARKVVAEARTRVKGRFVKSTSSGFVSITQVSSCVY